jgi:hypothetical protein
MKKEFINMKNLVAKAFIYGFLMVLIQTNIKAQEFHGGVNTPVYIGGYSALEEFIKKNLMISDTFEKTGVKGIVTVKISINKEGVAEEIKLMRGISEKYDAEAIRLARLLKDWIPANNGGKPVSCDVLLPIAFDIGSSTNDNQPIVVSGVVSEKCTSNPVEGALIMIKGTNFGTMTDSIGRYKLEVPGENYELEIASIGYNIETEAIGKNRTINIELDKGYCKFDFKKRE